VDDNRLERDNLNVGMALNEAGGVCRPDFRLSWLTGESTSFGSASTLADSAGGVVVASAARGVGGGG
jgi:hypothetical protein